MRDAYLITTLGFRIRPLADVRISDATPPLTTWLMKEYQEYQPISTPSFLSAAH
jgi:hypothetical protein